MTFEIYTQENADGKKETAITIRYTAEEDLEELKRYIMLALFAEDGDVVTTK